LDFYIVCSRLDSQTRDEYCIIKSITMGGGKITKIEGVCVPVGAEGVLNKQLKELHRLVKGTVENIPPESIIGARFEVKGINDESGTQIIKN